MVGDDVPRFSVLQAASGAAYFENRPLSDHIHAGVTFVLQNAENGGRTPNPVTAGNIVGMIAVRRFVLAGGGDVPVEQLPRDSGGVDPLGGKLEDELHNGSGLRVRLHSAIGAFAVAVGTDFALILAALHLGVLGALGLDGHIAAVIFADEILECYVHAAGVTLEFAAVKIVADGNEAGMEQREHALDKVAGFNAVSPEAGKILDDDAVDLIGSHQLNELLYLRTLKDDAAVSIVDLFGNDLNIRVVLHKVFNELALIGNAVALTGMIVGVGQADISGGFVFGHEKALLSPGLLPHEKSGYLAIWFSSFSTPIIALSAEKARMSLSAKCLADIPPT